MTWSSVPLLVESFRLSLHLTPVSLSWNNGGTNVGIAISIVQSQDLPDYPQGYLTLDNQTLKSVFMSVQMANKANMPTSHIDGAEYPKNNLIY